MKKLNVLINKTFTWLCFLNYLLKLIFLFNQIILKINTHIKFIK